MASQLCNNLKDFLLKTSQKSFLQRINNSLMFSNVFGCVFFNIQKTPAYINICFSLPLQILYLAYIFHFIFSYTKQSYRKTSILWTFELLCTFWRHLGIIFLTAYLVIRRNHHRKIVLKLHQFNKRMDMEKQQYYRIDYPLLSFILILIAIISLFYVVVTNWLTGKVQASVGRLITNHLVLAIFCIHIYLMMVLIGEIQRQFFCLNQKIAQSLNCATNLSDIRKMNKVVGILELGQLRGIIANSAMELNAFLSPFVLQRVILTFLMVVAMSDAVFVLLRGFPRKGAFDFDMSLVVLVKISFYLSCMVLEIKNWLYVKREVGGNGSFALISRVIILLSMHAFNVTPKIELIQFIKVTVSMLSN